MTWNIVFAKRAKKDAREIAASNLKPKAEELLDILVIDPFQNPPSFEKLIGDLDGAFSRRINIQHRLVYEVFEEEKTVKVLSMWSHYE